MYIVSHLAWQAQEGMWCDIKTCCAKCVMLSMLESCNSSVMTRQWSKVRSIGLHDNHVGYCILHCCDKDNNRSSNQGTVSALATWPKWMPKTVLLCFCSCNHWVCLVVWPTVCGTNSHSLSVSWMTYKTSCRSCKTKLHWMTRNSFKQGKSPRSKDNSNEMCDKLMEPPGLTFTKACDIKTCCAKCTFLVLIAMLESAVVLLWQGQ